VVLYSKNINSKNIICFSAGLLIARYAFYADTPGGKWRGNANLAFSKSSGNTDSSTFSAAVDDVRPTAADNISAYATSLYGSSNGVKSNDKTRLGACYDYNLSPQLFGFGLGWNAIVSLTCNFAPA
jgi:putative salt-induced outer membrane protein YdiY